MASSVRSCPATTTISRNLMLQQRAARSLVRQPAATRHASTSSTSSASASASPSLSLPWDSYFKLRKSRSTFGTIAAVPTTIAGMAVGGGYFANLESNPGELILGFEPIIIYGVAILGCVAGGWLSGPIIGNALWKLSHRNVLSSMEQMDNVFLSHIKRRRVDPSRQSVNNPVPDYYGERVNSKKQYRQWLRDQAAYRRKATFGAVAEEA